MHKVMISNDLIARNPGYSFTETTVGGMTLVEFKDGDSAVVEEATKIASVDAYISIRRAMGYSDHICCCGTTTQKNALTGVMPGANIFDTTLGTQQTYDGTSWV